MKTSFKLVLAYALLLLLVALMFSCTTQRKVERWNDKHLDKAAEYCAETFPVKDSTSVDSVVTFDTLYLEGEPEIIKDSFYIKGDTVIKVITKKCPQVQTIYKTVRKDSFVLRRDKAAEYVLESKLQASNVTIIKTTERVKILEEKIKTKNKKIWWLLAALAVCVGWNFRKLIFKLIKPI
jgi:hypothetical protein